jgi:tetratricopeptide (TPR) repeat protein
MRIPPSINLRKSNFFHFIFFAARSKPKDGPEQGIMLLLFEKLADRMSLHGGGYMPEVDAVQRERDRKIVTILYSFLHAIRIFRRMEIAYRAGVLKFSDLANFVDDRGQSFLFTLKSACHDLFRQSPSNPSEREQIFDLTVGSIFHLAMKLREDLYQLEFYGPKYRELGRKSSLNEAQEALVSKFKEVLSRADDSLKEGMKEVALLMEDSFRQLNDLLEEYRENGLLLRFLLEEKKLVEDTLGENGVERIFRFLYGQDASAPYHLAGESYFQSGFYSQAIRSFSRALEKDPENQTLTFKIYLARGMEQFYAFNLDQALKSFEECLALTPAVEFPEIHRAMVRKACQKIQEEIPGKKKDDQHRDLMRKAAALQKKLQDLPPAASEP